MARGWHYDKLSPSSALCLPLFFFWYVLCVIVPFILSFLSFLFVLFCFVFMLLLKLCRCSSDIFPVQQTTYRIGNRVYYWVWLRLDRLM